MPPESDTQDVQKARTFFQYGNEAALKSNLDYAIDMYKQACKLSPDSLIFRQALRGVQRRKFNNEPSKVGRLAGARNQPIRMAPGRRVSKGALRPVPGDLRGRVHEQPVGRLHGARGRRGGRDAQLFPAGSVVS